MKITFLVGSHAHPILKPLENWLKKTKINACIRFDSADLPGGDLLFLISFDRLVNKTVRSQYKNTLVIHASDLPSGRGWSPHVWSILNGAESLTLSLLEAEDQIDSGAIWKKIVKKIPRSAVFEDINAILFEAEFELIDFGINEFKNITPHPQSKIIPVTYYRKRTPKDSELDPSLSIEDQFDLLRVADPERYPAYFKLRGETYSLTLTKHSKKL